MALTPPKAPKPGLARPPPTNEDALAKAKREKDELEAEVQAVEEELEELKAKYDQWFLGVERLEPGRWREEVRKKVLRLKTAFTRNTGLRFRIQSLHARYLSYERLWLRSAREKEEGTYYRDVVKARMHRKEEPPPPREPATAPSAPAAKPGAPKAPAAPARGATPPAAGGMNDSQMRALYNAYLAAKMTCKEDVSKLSYDAVARTVTKQIPELMARYKAKSVDFKVEVKNGKAILKAIPRV